MSTEVLLGTESDQQEQTSAWALAANLITSGLGIGILSLPWSAAGASIIPGAIVTACVMLVMAWTSCIVVEAGEKYQVFDLGSLLGLLPGRLGVWTEGLCNTIIWIGGLMCLIGYVMVVADSVQPLLSGDLAEHRASLIVAASLVCFLLCFLEQRYLSFSSSLAIAVNVYLFLFVAYLAGAGHSDGRIVSVCNFGFGRGLISMSSTLCTAVAVQIFCLPMYQTLEGRSVRRFRTVVFSSFAFLFVLFVAFQTAALYAFGPGILQDVLSELPQSPAGNIARLGTMAGMVPLVFACYPLNVIPLVAPIRNAQWGGKKAGNIAIVGIAAITMVCGIFVTQLGVLNVINGAMTVVIIDAVGPALIGLYLLDKNKFAMMFLIVGGIVMTILGLCFTENYVDDMISTCVSSPDFEKLNLAWQ